MTFCENMFIADSLEDFFRFAECHNAIQTEIELQRIAPMLLQIMKRNPQPMGIKDNQSRFVYSNQAYIDLLNLPEGFELKGKTNSELPASTSEFSQMFIAHDRTTEKAGTTVKSLEIHPFGPQQITQPYIFCKTPIYNRCSEPLGTFFHCMPLHENISLFTNIVLGRIENAKTVTATQRTASEAWKLKTPTELLSEKVWEALFLYGIGLGDKQIGTRLDISTTAARARINRACQTLKIPVSQISDFMRARGWLSHIPRRFLHEYHRSLLLDEDI
ncbi:PAS domain-containing protein [Dongshaea marina]|uniref:PAS domain-containing protein n=1 Tax=Dongshaea marina TaxID=2047966 RepID=UPI00131EE759|nr:PAS domain-containing protein [Dongshaea marina]